MKEGDNIGPIRIVKGEKEWKPSKKDVALVNRWWRSLPPLTRWVIYDDYQTAFEDGPGEE